MSLLHTTQSLPEHFLFLFRVRFGVAQMHCLEEIDVDLSKLLYYSCTAEMLPQTQLAEHLKPASLHTHPRYFPVFHWNSPLCLEELEKPRFFVISALWESYRRAVTVNRSFFITQINVVASNIQGTFLFSFHRSIFLPCDFESYATTEFPDDNINKCAQCPLVERGPLNRIN